MSNSDSSLDVNPAEERSRLNEGLQNCRAVLESYRVILAGQTDEPDPPPAAFNDNSE